MADGQHKTVCGEWLWLVAGGWAARGWSVARMQGIVLLTCNAITQFCLAQAPCPAPTHVNLLLPLLLLPECISRGRRRSAREAAAFNHTYSYRTVPAVVLPCPAAAAAAA